MVGLTNPQFVFSMVQQSNIIIQLVVSCIWFILQFMMLPCRWLNRVIHFTPGFVTGIDYFAIRRWQRCLFRTTGPPGKKYIYKYIYIFLFCQVKQSRGRWELRLPSAHHPLRSSRLYRSSSRTKVADATSGEEEEPCDKVCKNADAWVGFKSDVWRHFSLPVSMKQKKMRTDRTFFFWKKQTNKKSQ